MSSTPIKVPVFLYGEQIGEALVGPQGQIFIDIEQNPKGREMLDILLMGFIDHFTLAPQHHYAPKKVTNV